MPRISSTRDSTRRSPRTGSFPTPANCCLGQVASMIGTAASHRSRIGGHGDDPRHLLIGGEDWAESGGKPTAESLVEPAGTTILVGRHHIGDGVAIRQTRHHRRWPVTDDAGCWTHGCHALLAQPHPGCMASGAAGSQQQIRQALKNPHALHRRQWHCQEPGSSSICGRRSRGARRGCGQPTLRTPHPRVVGPSVPSCSTPGHTRPRQAPPLSSPVGRPHPCPLTPIRSGRRQ